MRHAEFRKDVVISASILILTKNGARDMGTLLQNIFSQKGAKTEEVILIDSGSSDATLEIARGFPVRIEHIPAETFHHARTRNFSAGLASSEVLIFLSQDAIPASDDWLASMLVNFEDPKVGAVYGRQLPKTGSSLERQDALDTLYGEERLVKDPALPNRMGFRFYHFSDANAAFRRSVWAATGFPEELKVFEDLGIAKRILDAGWKIVYEPKACVLHSHQHSTWGLLRRYFDIGYTLKCLQIWNARGVGSWMLREGAKMLHQNLTRSVGRKEKKRAALSQNIAKSVGLFLGLQQRYLPLVVKRHLSAHGIFADPGMK